MLKSECENIPQNNEIKLSIKHIFEELALNLVNGMNWGGGSTLPMSLISAQQLAFRSQANGIRILLTGTSLLPIGTPCFKYMGVELPQDWIDQLETNKYWPGWHKTNEK